MGLPHLQERKIAFITGGNKGIGLETARKIAGTPNWLCVIGVRTDIEGKETTLRLAAENKQIKYIILDLNDEKSQDKCCKELESLGRLDCLINNAAVCMDFVLNPVSQSEMVHPTMNTNFFNTVKFTEKLLPLLRKSPCARVVNVSSALGKLEALRDETLRLVIGSAGEPGGIGKEDLIAIGLQLVSDVEQGIHLENGWPYHYTCYVVSKMLLIAYTRVLASEEPGMVVSACDTGFCCTDLNCGRGSKTPAEGAKTPFHCSQLSSDAPSGLFWKDERPIEW